MCKNTRVLFTFYADSPIFNISSFKKLFSVCMFHTYIFIYKHEHAHLHILFFNLLRVGCKGECSFTPYYFLQCILMCPQILLPSLLPHAFLLFLLYPL